MLYSAEKRYVLPGMNIYAAIFLIPFSVVLYTMTGGLKVIKPTIQHSFLPKQCYRVVKSSLRT